MKTFRKLRKTGSISAFRVLINTARLIWHPQALGLTSELAVDRRKHVCGIPELTLRCTTLTKLRWSQPRNVQALQGKSYVLAQSTLCAFACFPSLGHVSEITQCSCCFLTFLSHPSASSQFHTQSPEIKEKHPTASWSAWVSLKTTPKVTFRSLA